MSPELRTVLAHAPAFTLEPTSALGFGQRQSRDVLRTLSIGVKCRKMLTDDLIRLIAFKSLGAGIPTGHAPLAIQHVNRVISNCLNEQPVATVARFCGFEA